MQSSGIPPKFPIRWGASAASSFIRPIPTLSQTGITPGAASLADGFVPLNSTPVAAGGIPPFMQDFNGILNQITAWQQWQQAGGPIAYDPAFQTSIGGYPNGAIVQSATTFGVLWTSSVDNNLSNPDSGGAGWLQFPLQRGMQVFRLAGLSVFVPPAGIMRVRARVWGAGGGGGYAQGSNAGGSGGGGGGYSEGFFSITPGAGLSITVGAGGLGGNQVAAPNGTAGGTSSFASFCSATGGSGGFGAQNSLAITSVSGGVGSGGLINFIGGGGYFPYLISGGVKGGTGGTSYGCGGVEGPSLGSNGIAGAFPGTGGSGASTLASSISVFVGGAGNNGMVVVDW